jgi:integrase
VSGPEAAGGWRHRAPSGLLEKLMAAVRPEFREDTLVFDPADPVFGGASCAVGECGRAARYRGLCHGHHQRWVTAGRPGQYPVDDDRPWHGHGPLLSCRVPGCGFGVMGRQLCPRHLHSWKRAGSPDTDAWMAFAGPAARAGEDTAECRIGYCSLWAHPGSVFCYSHRRRWKQTGSPDPEEFTWSCESPSGETEQADLSLLAPHLRLEMQYALQCRSDDNTIKTRPSVVRSAIRTAARSGVASLLDLDDREWREQAAGETRSPVTRLVLYARLKVDTLDKGQGWESEYPRDTWRLRRLGIDSSHATICFTGIGQPWLRGLAKRWTRWRFSTGISASTCYRGAHAVTRFSVFLGQAGVRGPARITREILERYLAVLQTEVPGTKTRRSEIGLVNTFLQAVRRHEWDVTLPPSAMFFPEDYPKDGEKLPRALAEHVMAQVEAPAALARQANPAYRLVTLILIRCGLRASDAIKIPFDCVVRDADGAPYLRYYNRKMKREALVPVDEELESLIAGQQDRVLQRWPARTPVLFPRAAANIDGHRPVSYSGYRDALYRWLRECDVRDEHGQPAHLTPHQWRHTLGTRLINRDVPQHVVQKILDHDSAEMTAHYARLSDKTVREHWEKARKVNAEGQPVQVSPEGQLGEAAWAKQRLSRATQALPNGYCELPMVKTCPHANSCLTCPMFVTTAEFLPQHHAQRQQTLQIITAAEANGQARVAEMNRQVAGNLDKIITALEDDGRDGREEAANAS